MKETPCVACWSLRRKVVLDLEELELAVLGLDHGGLVIRVWKRHINALKAIFFGIKWFSLVDLRRLVVAHLRGPTAN